MVEPLDVAVDTPPLPTAVGSPDAYSVSVESQPWLLPVPSLVAVLPSNARNADLNVPPPRLPLEEAV